VPHHPPPRIGALFAGYGGLELAVQEHLGGSVAWHAEVAPGPSTILAHRFPGVPNLGDVTAVDWQAVEPVEVLTGGFPCQDVSLAGRRRGLRPDTRSGLWTHYAYAIEQLRPRLVVIENVRGLLSARAASSLEPDPWNVGDESDLPLRALGAVLGSLADLGYDASWQGLRASDVGAPHERFRVFVLAWPTGDAPDLVGEWRRAVRGVRAGGAGQVGGAGSLPAENAEREPRDERGLAAPGQAESRRPRADPGGRGRVAPADPDDLAGWTGSDADETERSEGRDESRGGAARRSDAPDAARPGSPDRVSAGTEGQGLEGDAAERCGRHPGEDAGALRPGIEWGRYARAIRRWEAVLGRPAPHPHMSGKGGSARLAAEFAEWMMGLPAGWVTQVPGLSRAEQIKALGNGVCPQQAAEALRLLLPDVGSETIDVA
jgi:DNA (cytosine-5)-methyltransferase 1